MEVAGCIPLLLQSSYIFSPPTPICSSFFLKPIFLMFSSTCSLHFILNQPCLCFSSTSYTIAIIKTSFFRLSQNMTIPPHTIHACQLICSFLQPQLVHQLQCIPLVHQFYTAHHSYHRSLCSS